MATNRSIYEYHLFETIEALNHQYNRRQQSHEIRLYLQSLHQKLIAFYFSSNWYLNHRDGSPSGGCLASRGHYITCCGLEQPLKPLTVFYHGSNSSLPKNCLGDICLTRVYGNRVCPISCISCQTFSNLFHHGPSGGSSHSH